MLRILLQEARRLGQHRGALNFALPQISLLLEIFSIAVEKHFPIYAVRYSQLFSCLHIRLSKQGKMSCTTSRAHTSLTCLSTTTSTLPEENRSCKFELDQSELQKATTSSNEILTYIGAE